MGKKIISLILLSALVLSFTSCQGKAKALSSIEVENAQLELDQYCNQYPVNYGYNKRFLCDITKDGVQDLCACFSCGNGLIRNIIVVYDIINETFYQLDGQSQSYFIETVDNERLIVVQSTEEYFIMTEDGIKHNPAAEGTYGTIDLDKDQLVFTPRK